MASLGERPRRGAKTLVVTNGDAALAESVAAELAQRVWALRETYRPASMNVPEAMAAIREGDGPVVLADISDNAAVAARRVDLPARGAIGRRCGQGALRPDLGPVAVRICEEAGEGASLPLRIGGKISPASGSPVDLDVRVLKLIRDATMSYAGGTQAMGNAALVEAGGVRIVLNTIRTQTFHPDAYTQFGLDLAEYRVIVVKSAQHFHAGFGPVAKHILLVVALGRSPDFTTIKVPKPPPAVAQVEDPFSGE